MLATHKLTIGRESDVSQDFGASAELKNGMEPMGVPLASSPLKTSKTKIKSNLTVKAPSTNGATAQRSDVTSANGISPQQSPISEPPASQAEHLDITSGFHVDSDGDRSILASASPSGKSTKHLVDEVTSQILGQMTTSLHVTQDKAVSPSLQPHQGPSGSPLVMSNPDDKIIFAARQQQLHASHPREIVHSGALNLDRYQVDPHLADGVSATNGDTAPNLKRLLRRLQRATEAVLIKRTQWLQENQTLENCRSYLRESTHKLLEMISAERRLEPLSQAPTSESFGNADGWHGDTQTDELGYPDQIQTFGPEGSELVDAFDVTSRSLSIANIATLREQNLEDLVLLEAQEGRVKALVQDLSNREFRLHGLQQEIIDIIRANALASNNDPDMTDESPLTPVTTSRAPSETTLPAPVEQYFDALGDLHWQGERLREAEERYNTGLQEREFLRDRGDKLEIADDVFEANYKAERATLEESMSQVREQIIVRGEECKRLDLDPERFRHTGRSNESHLQSVAAQSHLVDDVGVPEQVPVEQPSPPLNASTSGQALQQVEGWRVTVAEADPLPPSDVDSLMMSRLESEKGFDDDYVTSIESLASFEARSFDINAFDPVPKEAHPNIAIRLGTG